MRSTFTFLFGLLLAGSLGAQSFVDPTTPSDAVPDFSGMPADWELVFSDEFGADSLDLTKWVMDDSPRSRAPRGNDEGTGYIINEWYWRPDNVSVENGNLVLRVDKVDDGIMHTGSVRSDGLYQSRYGYYECRVLIGQADLGTHTAFWMTSAGQANIDSTGHDGAEVDIFESAWYQDYTKAVIHIDGYAEGTRAANTLRYETPGLHNGEYHTFGMMWTEDEIRIYYDGDLGVRGFDTTETIYGEVNGNERFIPRVAQYLWLSNGASFGTPAAGPAPFMDNFTLAENGVLTRAYFDYVRVWQPPSFGCATPELELENFTPENDGGTVAVINNADASGGSHVRMRDVSPGDNITFEICQNVAGYYTLELTHLAFLNFGTWAASVEVEPDVWVDLPGEIDMYSRESRSRSVVLPEIYLPIGNHRVRFTSTGQNAASSNFFGSFDRLDVSISDLPQTCFGAGPGGSVSLTDIDAEDAILNDAEIQSCATARNGEYVRLSTDNVSSVGFIANVAEAGTYALNVGYMSAIDRQAEVVVNGISLGDQTFTDSGRWCFEGGSPGLFTMEIALEAGDNEILIVRSGPPIFVDYLGVAEICESLALPIDLAYFRAVAQQKSVLLTWATASEVDNDFVAVERSTDGLNFTEIGRRDGAGTRDSQSDYELLDEDPQTGLNYYRLRQFDLDGSVNYSEVITVRFSGEVRSGLKIYPTQVKSGSAITVDLTAAEPSTEARQFTIVDQAGREVSSYQLQSSAVHSLRGLSLPPGLYYLTEVGVPASTTRFVVVR
ncbi:family 16 glycosylhydrolase [Lewinella sp. 4G2]|uniref:family 16 glycosylhydrolase n=1 Tax=Lewinella sp. 4G2 TaxID=1803372 RepID=UPI0007B4E018|nr:family 16 glycosylhydrolase [Lewinella sp. 4G2]OAV45282.1 hypothetical protein A3850_012605 [Lewinella sp. 4G2]